MAQVHAVLLNLPMKLCVDQATNRIAHEGNLSGEAARTVIQQMNRQFQAAGQPSHVEGFLSILVRHSVPCKLFTVIMAGNSFMRAVDFSFVVAKDSSCLAIEGKLRLGNFCDDDFQLSVP